MRALRQRCAAWPLLDASGNTGDAAGDTYVLIEDLLGSNFDDTLGGNGGSNTLTGLNGADTLAGNGGNDTLDGGAGRTPSPSPTVMATTGCGTSRTDWTPSTSPGWPASTISATST